ncbi:MAG: ribonuclease domain-containing protein [Nocardioides sp.]
MVIPVPPRTSPHRPTGAAALALVLLLAVGIWLLAGRDPGSQTGTPDPTTSLDPASGLPWVDVSDLPPEAVDELRLIDAGGPFRHDQDGQTFGNFEGLLPAHARGYYAEYTVETPGSSDRGARRIIAGDGGEYYWTPDHYQSFDRIRR